MSRDRQCHYEWHRSWGHSRPRPFLLRPLDARFLTIFAVFEVVDCDDDLVMVKELNFDVWAQFCQDGDSYD